jgi:molybdopterin converting factor small subunit
MLVHIPSPLRSYTKNQSEIQVDGDSVQGLLANMDKSYPGIRFRMIDEQDGIREHIKLYVDRKQIETLNMKLNGTETIHIICALSGG